MSKVLVIEDEELVRSNIAEVLQEEGFYILEADDGLVGVQLAKAHLPDLIVCDIMMPHLDGYGVLLELRSDPTTTNIPFIFLTARGERSYMRQGMELGADDYMTKPFTPQELVAAVNARLARSESQQRERQAELDRLRSTLSNTLPHELRTPLVGILGYAEMLEMNLDDLSRQQMLQYVQRIQQAGKQLYRMIENYLLYAQIEVIKVDSQGAAGLRNVITDNPGEIAARITQERAAEWQRPDDLALQVEDAPVRISAENFGKIVEELGDNAFKFSDMGMMVQVTVKAQDDWLALTVRDSGRGMTSEQVRTLGAYTQFKRDQYGQAGIGLGLVVAKHLAELHGGEMSIASAPGEGTEITVRLPVALS
jgi:signal transduction histidine kinase